MTSLTIEKYNLGMRLFKRSNGVYYIELRRGIWRSLKTRDEKEARSRFKEVEREALKGKLLILDRQPAITLRDFFNEYDKWLSDNKAYNTYSRVHRIIPKFLDAAGSQTLIHTLDFNNLDTYVAYCRARRNSAITINLEIRHIKAALTWGVSRKFLKSTPFKGYEELPENKKDPQFLTIEQIQKVFNAIGNNRKYRLIFALYVYTGARREEIWRLEWKDINEDVVMIRKTKTYKPREVPISENLKIILDEHARGVGRLFNVSLAQMGRRIKYYLKKAGIGYLRPHDLRHTFASHLIMAGVDLKTVGELLGHTSYAATQIYTHLLKEHKVKAIGKLPY